MLSGVEPRKVSPECSNALDDAYEVGYMLGLRGQEKPKDFKLSIDGVIHEIPVFRSRGQYSQFFNSGYKKGAKDAAFYAKEGEEWAIAHSELALAISKAQEVA